MRISCCSSIIQGDVIVHVVDKPQLDDVSHFDRIYKKSHSLRTSYINPCRHRGKQSATRSRP